MGGHSEDLPASAYSGHFLIARPQDRVVHGVRVSLIITLSARYATTTTGSVIYPQDPPPPTDSPANATDHPTSVGVAGTSNGGGDMH